MDAIDHLLEIYGNIQETAKAIGESRQTVEHWVKEGRIPYKQGANIEEKTGGRVTAISVWQSAARTNSNGGHRE